MADAPAVSIVIPTFNRRSRLARVLDALEQQTTAPERFEVVVVDDGSSDGTSDALASERRRFALCAIRQDNAGPARARNTGVAAAAAELVLFIDDDVEPLPQLVSEHLDSHAAHPRSVVIGPLLSLPHYPQPWVAWEQLQLERQYDAMQRRVFEPTYRQFWTGNASVSRREVMDAGGFDTTLLRGEDVELGFRLARRGLNFHYNPLAGGLHHAERSLASWEHAHRSYGRLEVDIFGRSGEGELIDILAGNWSRLHPGTRVLIRSCAGHAQRTRQVSAALRRSIELAARTRSARATRAACSLLANLLYWDACLAALGPERSARMYVRSKTAT